MDVRSYPGKVFVVVNSETVIRDENLNPVRYQAGDNIPPGKHVGSAKLIPVSTKINVTDVRATSRKDVFVFARPANDSTGSFGWTRADNLAGGFVGEFTGFAPAKYEKEPDGNNKTCFDPSALIRGGPPHFASTGNKIPQGSFVMATETSNDRLNVKVSKLEIVNGEMVVGAEIGWTRVANLADGCSDQFSTPEWFDEKGPYACWDHGAPKGSKVMVNVIGAGSDLEQVTFENYLPYLKLAKAAADEANLSILIHSAFRTFDRQAELYHAYKHKHGHKAAEPGRSNHQHGQAFDLNTEENVFDGSDQIYEWLAKNGPRHGFVRTVSEESWHWEYKPKEAAELPPGKFKIPKDIT